MPTRRTFIKQVSVAAAMGAVASMGLGFASMPVRAAGKGNGYMPDEGDKHQRTFIAFGAQAAIWEDFTPHVQDTLGRIARSIAEYEPVTVFCRQSERRLAEAKCGSHNTCLLYTSDAADE